MERTKRQHKDTIQNSNSNKKRKSHDTITIVNENKSLFEDLANEILYEIYEYLDIYHVYEGFFDLNHRFQHLLINSNLPITINISTMSKSSFERYHKNILIPNKHRISILRLSNPFTVDIIFSPPRIITRFLRLEVLILDNIKAKYLDNIFDYLMLLPKFHSLILSLADYVQSLTLLFFQIFHLSKLKYFKITYQIKHGEEHLPIYSNEYEYSSIEHLVINGHFRFDSFYNLLSCLPRLRHLSINCLYKSRYIETKTELSPIRLKHLKYVSLELDYIDFNRFEKIIKNVFRHVQVLRLTTKFDQAYLDARRWEELILTSMPNLRIFDINHDGSARNNHLSYHDLINQFNSSFWIENQWFFTHQHDWLERLNSGIFYSIDPYRRKDYTFYWQLDKQLCPHLQERNLNSVKHVLICSKRATNNSVNYFPNATELTIERYFETPDDSITTTLNRIIPLKQLTKLVIGYYDFPFEEIVKLLYFTPNLHTLKLDLISFYGTNSKVIQKNDIYQHISKTNKIQSLIVRDHCTLEKIQLIINLFPQLENLKTGMNRKEIEQIMRFLLSRTNNKTRRLFFLCISETPKICLKELNLLIKLENLLDDYFIKFVNRDLYLWW